MKIGLVLERFDPVRGGLEHWTCQFARRLVALGHEVHVVAFEFYPGASADGIIAHKLDMPESRLERGVLLAGRIPSLGLDIVHDMGIGWTADVIHPHGGSTKALWEHNLLRIPRWRQIRFWREKRYRELEELERRQHANHSAIIVAVSEMVSQHFQKLHRLPPSRIRVIHNGVEVEKFTPEIRQKYRESTRQHVEVEDEVLFLMLAHNLLLKNADTAIRAIAELIGRGAPARMLIAGGKKPDRFIALAKKLDVTRFVRFMGQIDPLPYYAAADAFIHPTWYDPCSLVTLEASSCGLPVVTSRFNGAAEMMTGDSEGFVLSDPADVSALANRMEETLDAHRRSKMSAGGRAMAMRNTFENQTTRFVELYKEIMARRHLNA